jgi:hypothetical protein
MRRAPFLLLSLVVILACSDNGTAPEPPAFSVSEAFSDATMASKMTTVPPSRKCSDNATAIQLALNNAQSGDVVFLTDGDATTVDTYCVDEGIVVLNGFDGTLKGEGMDQTIIEAVAGPGKKPFHFDFNSGYVNIPGNPNAGIWPTVLHFEFPVDVTVSDLTITELDPGHPGNYFQFIAIWGGDHNAVFENLALRGSPPSPEWLVGIHAMAGPEASSLDGRGTVLIRNVEIDDVGDGIDPMWYGDGSAFRVEGVRTTNAFWGMWVRGLTSGLQVTGSTFTASVGAGILLREVSNAIISDNTIKDQHFGAWWRSGIYLRDGVRNSVVTRNRFENLSGDLGQAIFLPGFGAPVAGNTIDHNTFTQSGLPGWTADTPNGPGAIRLGLGAFDNEVFEPDYLVGQGKGLCQMLWDQTDDESTTQYDGVNKIHGWQPCELFPERGSGKEGSGAEPDFLRGRF